MGEGATSISPRVTALHDGRRRVVAGTDPAAAALGLRAGMALAHAMALAPGLDVAEAEPHAEQAALSRLALWCHHTTPLAAADGADGLWLDVTGCAHLWGGEAPMLADLAQRLAAEGLHARLALADTPGAAHALARYGAEACIAVPPGEQRAALAPLPVRALRIPADTAATLRRLGFDHIGDLLHAPRAGLSRRLGPHVCRRLDQAMGAAPEPIVPIVPPETLQHRLCFIEPLLTAEALETAIAAGLAPLCARMEQSGQGARRIDVLFERVDGTIQAIRIGTARPSRDAAHLLRMLTERLDTIDPGLGIEAMRIVAPLAEPLRWTQQGADAAPDVSVLVDRLCNRLGSERVYRVAPVESDVPERSVRRVPALAEPGGVTWPDSPRPTRLLHPPRPVEALALLPDQPPVAFTWRRRRHRIRRADGPERIYGEWWRRDAETHAVRDYFQVEDEDGQRFWLFRQGDGVDPATGGLSWYLHGLF